MRLLIVILLLSALTEINAQEPDTVIVMKRVDNTLTMDTIIRPHKEMVYTMAVQMTKTKQDRERDKVIDKLDIILEELNKEKLKPIKHEQREIEN